VTELVVYIGDGEAISGLLVAGRLKLTQDTFQFLPVELVARMTKAAVHDCLTFSQQRQNVR
jgi:hypothetical protein